MVIRGYIERGGKSKRSNQGHHSLAFLHARIYFSSRVNQAKSPKAVVPSPYIKPFFRF